MALSSATNARCIHLSIHPTSSPHQPSTSAVYITTRPPPLSPALLYRHHHCWLAVSVFSLDPSVSVRFRRGDPSGDGACGPHDARGARAAWLTECSTQHGLVKCWWCAVNCLDCRLLHHHGPHHCPRPSILSPHTSTLSPCLCPSLYTSAPSPYLHPHHRQQQ
jgi:hypothetical protein